MPFPQPSLPKPYGIPDPNNKGGNSIGDIKSKILNPALTSLYYVTVGQPQDKGWKLFSSSNLGNIDSEKLNLMCCEASLPGSSLATLELTNDRTGVTERHAYRRVYDDRIDLTFYVDAENYGPIRYFETWMKYISQESVADSEAQGKPSSAAKNYFYSLQYPDSYVDEQGLTITKFEKSTQGIGEAAGKRGKPLTYVFVRSYPISITSMPVSYDSSSLLKCTVSMTYIRYLVNDTDAKIVSNSNQTSANDATTAVGFQNSGILAYDSSTDILKGTNITPLGQSAFNSGFGAYSGNSFFVPQSTTDVTQQATLATNATQNRQGVTRDSRGFLIR